MDDNRYNLVSPSFILIVSLTTTVVLIFGQLFADDNNQTNQSWLKGEYTKAVDTKEEAIENDYTFYLNGEEIDPKKYNFKNYDLEYNTEDKIVTVSKKTSIF